MNATAVNNSDVVLTLTNQSYITGFLGYELERRLTGGNWCVWTGTAWVDGGTASLLTTIKFTDYTLAAGIYQYRARAKSGTDPAFSYTSYEESGWIRIATAAGTKTGWTFGNYTPAEDEFGLILTPDDLRYTYLWGIDFKASNGQLYDDNQIQFMIDSAVREFELALNLTIKKRVIKCRSDAKEGDVYDELEDPYRYRRLDWNVGGRLNTKRRPILSVEDFVLYTITDQKILDLKDWMRVNYDKGEIFFYPRVGPMGTIRVSPTFLSYNYLSTVDYPHGYRLSYTAGYSDSSKVPSELRDIIGKAAACRLLNIIGDGLIAGFASSSLSLDGISESFSSTQSATNAYFGARILVYLKDIKTFLDRNRYKYHTSFAGAI
jgi:hypothetical protein